MDPRVSASNDDDLNMSVPLSQPCGSIVIDIEQGQPEVGGGAPASGDSEVGVGQGVLRLPPRSKPPTRSTTLGPHIASAIGATNVEIGNLQATCGTTTATSFGRTEVMARPLSNHNVEQQHHDLHRTHRAANDFNDVSVLGPPREDGNLTQASCGTTTASSKLRAPVELSTDERVLLQVFDSIAKGNAPTIDEVSFANSHRELVVATLNSLPLHLLQ